jgi:peptide/nickel transport system substrate-binding protein
MVLAYTAAVLPPRWLEEHACTNSSSRPRWRSCWLQRAPADAQTLRWSSQGDPQTLDPVSQNESFTNAMNGQVYEFLVARDKQLGLVPALATEWKQDGPLRWTFKLRKGVKFHEGQAFTADDVVFSVNRAKEKTSQIATYANSLGRAEEDRRLHSGVQPRAVRPDPSCST